MVGDVLEIEEADFLFVPQVMVEDRWDVGCPNVLSYVRPELFIDLELELSLAKRSHTSCAVSIKCPFVTVGSGRRGRRRLLAHNNITSLALVCHPGLPWQSVFPPGNEGVPTGSLYIRESSPFISGIWDRGYSIRLKLLVGF